MWFNSKLMMTREIASEMDNLEFEEFVNNCLAKYVSQDWGDTCQEDWKMNDEALHSDDRVLAIYKNEKYGNIFIITEGDKSMTTIMFTHEY